MARMTDRPQTLGEEIANSISHGVALLAALVAAPFLIAGASHLTVASLAGAVVVVMARNPYDWMIQMWRKCYHCGAMQKVPAFRCGAEGGRRGRAGEGACVGRRLGFF